MLYTTVVIPGIRTVAVPLESETREDQVEALRVLAAGNTLIVLCLGLVLALQVCVSVKRYHTVLIVVRLDRNGPEGMMQSSWLMLVLLRRRQLLRRPQKTSRVARHSLLGQPSHNVTRSYCLLKYRNLALQYCCFGLRDVDR